MAAFNHLPSGPPLSTLVHPLSDSVANPSRWITQNSWPLPAGNPGNNLGFQGIHTFLIPSGPHRGEVLVLDGNLTEVGVRVYQPWSIVNPYWPAANPYTGAIGYRFHNATLLMPGTHSGMLQDANGAGELFCGDGCWMADGRLFFAGGTRMFPPSLVTQGLPVYNTGVGGGFEGSKLVYQWDERPNGGGGPVGPDPFGKWWPMPDLDVERWYATVATDGTAANRALILAGTDFNPATSTQDLVNSYESYLVPFNAQQIPVASFETKNTAAPLRRYDGPNLTTSPAFFTEYPRFHALGVFDPTPNAGLQPRLVVSAYVTKGIRWAHDPTINPAYAFDVGQMTLPPLDPWVLYPTCLLYPSAIGAIGTRVVRIGGDRVNAAQTLQAPTNLVESVVAGTPTSLLPVSWSTGLPTDIPNMQYARFWHNVVILPTGDLFAVGGVRDPQHVIFNFTPELFNGTQWLAMANHLSTHGYHSCAVLLPDGRVLVCGGEGRTWDYEIWEPPYFHLPSGSPRPTGISVHDAITGAPISDTALTGATWSQQLRAAWTNQLPDTVSVDRVVMMKPAAMTHHNDGGQRCIRLLTWHDEDSETSGNSVVFQLPAVTQHVPAGWWMVFLITSEGVPANAFWVNIG